MLGTIVNAVTIIICATLGLFIKGAQRFEKPVITALSLGVVFLGASGVINGLNQGTNTLLFLLSLVIGTVIGELIRIDERFNRFGEYLGRLVGNKGTFSKGFVTATLIYCIGAMSIIGPFEGALSGNHSILYAKSVMDGVTSIILASMYGVGVMFSGFAVLIYQGAFALLATYLSPFITADSIKGLSTVGNVLIAAIGFEMLGMLKIKYANMLPAMFIPVIFYLPVVQNVIAAIMGAFSM